MTANMPMPVMLGQEPGLFPRCQLLHVLPVHDDRAALEYSLALWQRIGSRFERACTLLLVPDLAAQGHAELAALTFPQNRGFTTAMTTALTALLSGTTKIQPGQEIVRLTRRWAGGRSGLSLQPGAAALARAINPGVDIRVNPRSHPWADAPRGCQTAL